MEEVWRQAMKEEIEVIEKKLTWELVEPSKKWKPINVKWVYRMKRNSTGEVTRFKARRIVKGYNQKNRVDYDEVFSLVAKVESIWILMALAAQFKWNLYHLDVKSAFLNGEIKEEIYVAQPEGFIRKGMENYVLKL